MLSKNSIFLESSVSVTNAFFTSGRLPCVRPWRFILPCLREVVTAETVTPVIGRHKFDQWKEKPNLDNHLFDATKMAFVASRMIGIMTEDEFELQTKLKIQSRADKRRESRNTKHGET